ncbi:MAG: hypothetical protein ACRDKT_12220 [Actinomycetota bacterium]
MSHIEVRPDALASAASALVRVGDALADTAAELAASNGAGDAANQPDVGAAFDEMLATWKGELRSLAHAVAATGRASRAAGSAYVETDRDVMPGPGR